MVFLGWEEILFEIIFPQQQRKGESLRGKEKGRKIRRESTTNVNIRGIWIKIIRNSLYCSFTSLTSLILYENVKVKEKNE